MGELVVKSNQVIEACYHLSAIEQRIILSAIAQIPKSCEITDNEIYYVSIDSLIDFGVHTKTAYRDLKRGVIKLYERSINLSQDDNSIKLRWVQEIHYTENSSIIGIRFSKPILPYISNVSREFTKYYLSDIKGMSSGYAIRIYELVTQYQRIGSRTISVEKLREMLELGKKYPLYADFKKRVVDIAVAQINELSPLEISYEEEKTGRKVTSLKFKFHLKPIKIDNNLKNSENTNSNDVNNLSYKQLVRIVQNTQFKLDYNHLISATHPANQNDNAWTTEMISRIKKQPNEFKKSPLESYLKYE